MNDVLPSSTYFVRNEHWSLLGLNGTNTSLNIIKSTKVNGAATSHKQQHISSEESPLPSPAPHLQPPHLYFNAFVSSGLTDPGKEPQGVETAGAGDVISLWLDPCSSDLLHNVWTRSVVRIPSVWSDVVFPEAFYAFVSDYLYGPAKSFIFCLWSTIMYKNFKCEEWFCFVANPHASKCMINPISKIDCTNPVLLKRISSLHTYSCKHQVCINWNAVFLVCAALLLPPPVSVSLWVWSLCHSDSTLAPSFLLKHSESQLSLSSSACLLVSSRRHPIGALRSARHIWSFQTMQWGAKRQEFRGTVAVRDSVGQNKKKQSSWAQQKRWGENFMHNKRDKYHTQLAMCLLHLITLKLCCRSPVIRLT